MTTTKELTDWFPGDLKPVRKGVYERRSIAGRYSFWTGSRWCMGFTYMDEVSGSKAASSFDQGALWRGLTSDPSKGAQ